MQFQHESSQISNHFRANIRVKIKTRRRRLNKTEIDFIRNENFLFLSLNFMSRV